MKRGRQPYIPPQFQFPRLAEFITVRPHSVVIDGRMILIQEGWRPHLGHQLNELQEKIRPRTMQKLQRYEQHTKQAYGLGALDTLFLLHHLDHSLPQLSHILEISSTTLFTLFEKVGFPKVPWKEATERFLASLTPQELQARMAKMQSKVTTEQRSTQQSQVWAALATEQRKQRTANWIRAGQAYLASLAPEQRSENSKKAYAAGIGRRTPEQKREDSREGGLAAQAALTSKQRSIRVRKSWDQLTPQQQLAQIARMNEAVTPTQRGEYIARANAALTPEKRRENAKIANSARTQEQKSEYARKARLAAEMKPNGVENIMIAMLQELGIYAEFAATAQKGQVYYADNKENRRYFHTPDGRIFIPDLKVKGLNAVFEIYGDFWHSQERCEPLGLPEYTWNPKKKIETYAAMGLLARVYWEHELEDPIRREVIKQEITCAIMEARKEISK